MLCKKVVFGIFLTVHSASLAFALISPDDASRSNRRQRKIRKQRLSWRKAWKESAEYKNVMKHLRRITTTTTTTTTQAPYAPWSFTDNLHHVSQPVLSMISSTVSRDETLGLTQLR